MLEICGGESKVEEIECGGSTFAIFSFLKPFTEIFLLEVKFGRMSE